MKEKIIQDIIELEWEMFSSVKNFGGRAACQEDQKTFKMMRASQAEAWNAGLLQSYFNDLLQSKSRNRNLMTEKYARMMETTYPEEFKKAADFLPVIEQKTLDLIEKIIEINLKWKVETAEKYPNLNKRGRAVYTKDDSRVMTSFETYLRGELKTYSPDTIQLYYDMTLEHWNKGENLEEISLLNTVKKIWLYFAGSGRKLCCIKRRPELDSWRKNLGEKGYPKEIDNREVGCTW